MVILRQRDIQLDQEVLAQALVLSAPLLAIKKEMGQREKEKGMEKETSTLATGQNPACCL